MSSERRGKKKKCSTTGQRKLGPNITIAEFAGAQDAREDSPAPVSRRFLAYLIDWYLGSLCAALPISIIAQRVMGDMANQRLVDFPAPWGMVAGALALLFSCLYYLAIPMLVWRGQTPGKRLCRIRIEMVDGSPVDLWHLVLREVVGVFLLSGVIANASSVWHQMATIALQVNLVHPLMYGGFALTAVSCALILCRHDHHCVHDFIGGTEVRLVAHTEKVPAPNVGERDMRAS